MHAIRAYACSSKLRGAGAAPEVQTPEALTLMRAAMGRSALDTGTVSYL